MNPYASPAAAAYTYAPQYPTGPRSGLPWETQPKSFTTWWETAKLCMMQPSFAYRIMWQYGGIGSPLLHAVSGIAIGTFGQLLWSIPLVVLASVAGNRGQGGPETAGLIGLQIGMQIGQAVFYLGVAVVLIFIGSAITPRLPDDGWRCQARLRDHFSSVELFKRLNGLAERHPLRRSFWEFGRWC